MTAALFDLAHHALGRPDGPHVKPYRNYFATDAGSAEAQAFAESPFWMRNGKESPGGLAYFHVTDAGIAAVWKWLREKQEAKGLRAYTVRVWWDELELPSERHVVAKSRGAAKYSAFLSVSDTWPELTFRRFCAFRIQVRGR
ncbi:hypothetical protein [Brevundimonas sp. TWP2-3-4b1]|uniref:hypothetical protein n=1 Tax=Brevundimonas sp. TWP2-3-4b1 TaxID=2804580 RepID=UPI003CECE25A